MLVANFYFHSDELSIKEYHIERCPLYRRPIYRNLPPIPVFLNSYCKRDLESLWPHFSLSEDEMSSIRVILPRVFPHHSPLSDFPSYRNIWGRREDPLPSLTSPSFQPPPLCPFGIYLRIFTQFLPLLSHTRFSYFYLFLYVPLC